MSDDGEGKHVRIRLSMISYKDGKKIKDVLDSGSPVNASIGHCNLLRFSYFN
jgi:hypothetical protein